MVNAVHFLGHLQCLLQLCYCAFARGKQPRRKRGRNVHDYKLHLQKQAAGHALPTSPGRKSWNGGTLDPRPRSFYFVSSVTEDVKASSFFWPWRPQFMRSRAPLVIRFHPSYPTDPLRELSCLLKQVLKNIAISFALQRLKS